MGMCRGGEWVMSNPWGLLARGGGEGGGEGSVRKGEPESGVLVAASQQLL